MKFRKKGRYGEDSQVYSEYLEEWIEFSKLLKFYESDERIRYAKKRSQDNYTRHEDGMM